MSKRMKKLIIILIILAVIYFLLIGASYVFLRVFVYPSFEDYRIAGAYPYSDAAIPEDYKEFGAAGLKLYAPDCLETLINNAEVSSYVGKDNSQYDLAILAYAGQNTLTELDELNKKDPNLIKKWIYEYGWLTRLGLKKIGYKIPENNSEKMYLLDRADPKDYNKFSLIEAYTFTKLSILKAIMIPAMISVQYDKENPLETPLSVEKCNYYYEADTFNSFIQQSRSECGRYQLAIICYPDSAPDTVQTVVILSDDPALVQTIAASVRPA